MLARVWGCRGSLAAPGADTVRYGGNTSCIEVQLDSGDTLVLDAGTGMRALGVEMGRNAPTRLHILLSHLHLDHVQGLGFFRPLFEAGREIHVWGPASPVQSLEDRIALYMSPPLFPVRLADIPARVVFHDAPIDEVTIGSARVRAGSVVHQGPTVGYRIEEDGGVLAYLPDHEPAIGVALDDRPTDWISGHDIACDADLLFHDAQYGDKEYPNHIGWGHSCIDHVVGFARRANVGTTVLFHHDPYHTDDELDALLVDAQRCSEVADERLCLAHEGMRVEIDGKGVRFLT